MKQWSNHYFSISTNILFTLFEKNIVFTWKEERVGLCLCKTLWAVSCLRQNGAMPTNNFCCCSSRNFDVNNFSTLLSSTTIRRRMWKTNVKTKLRKTSWKLLLLFTQLDTTLITTKWRKIFWWGEIIHRIVNILGNALIFQATRVTIVIRIVVYITFVIWVME